MLKVGDVVELRPGVVRRMMTKEGEKIYSQSLTSRIITLKAEENTLLFAVPGGLLGCGLSLDPYLTRSNRLVGNIIGYPDKMPKAVNVITTRYYLMRRLLGVKTDANKKSAKVS